MNWKTLKSRYPEIWDEVYDGMVTDLKQCMSGADIEQFNSGNKHSQISRIAHNAAFIACDAIRKNKQLIDLK